MAYLCMGCYEVYDRDLGRCPKSSCDCRVVEVDELMVPAIILLNQKGYMTEFCCSGHVYDNGCTSYVLLDSLITDVLGYEIENIKKILPKSWEIEIDQSDRIHFIHKLKMEQNCKIVTEVYKDILEANLAFLRFVKRLPELEY